MTNPIQINSEALDKFLEEDLGSFLQDTKHINETVNSLAVDTFSGNAPEQITLALQGFLERGSSVLETMEIYCNNMPDAESVNAFSSLISSLSSAINNIASVHQKLQDHQNKIELGQKNHEWKMKEIEFRERIKASIKAETISGNPEGGKTTEQLVEFNTNDIIDRIVKKND